MISFIIQKHIEVLEGGPNTDLPAEVIIYILVLTGTLYKVR